MKGVALSFPNGESVSAYVDSDQYYSSIHGGKLNCLDCHRDYAQYPHPKRDIQTARDYTLAQYDVCRRCHFANYTRTLDSIHFQVLSESHKNAPICTDCHGAHNVAKPDQPRTRIAQTCSTCHEEIYETYQHSIHGAALAEEGNPDVPTCTYCHGVHNIFDPREPSFHTQIPQLCGQCHSNRPLMDKYGLSTNVVKTYLADFHGATNVFSGHGAPDIRSYEAVCTDCHGIHDIIKTDDPSAPVFRENLVQVCRQCHPDANANFPAAWLGHYEPSIKHAPLVFSVKIFYSILIPFMVCGLGVQVLLNIWRAASNR